MFVGRGALTPPRIPKHKHNNSGYHIIRNPINIMQLGGERRGEGTPPYGIEKTVFVYFTAVKNSRGKRNMMLPFYCTG